MWWRAGPPMRPAPRVRIAPWFLSPPELPGCAPRPSHGQWCDGLSQTRRNRLRKTRRRATARTPRPPAISRCLPRRLAEVASDAVELRHALIHVAQPVVRRLLATGADRPVIGICKPGLLG